MTVGVGINGFGRIDTDTATLANLLQYDSTYGPLRERVHHTDDSIVVGGTMIRVTAQRDPAALDRRAVGVDIVIESARRFSTREAAAAHLTGGARKVILSSPGSGRRGTRLAPARTVGRCPSEAVAKCARCQ